MNESQLVSVFGSLLLAAILFSQRNSLRKFDCLGVFLCTETIFVLTGVLLLPWAMPYLGKTYSIGQTSNLDMFNWMFIEAFQEKDLVNAILLTVGGTLIVSCSYRIASMVLRNRTSASRHSPDATSASSLTNAGIDIGFNPLRLRLLSSLSLLCVLALLFAKRGTIGAGLHQGLLQGQHDAVLEARYAINQGGYFLWLMCCNILPFFAAAEWMLYRLKSNSFAWYPYVVVGIASVGLILLFQKRPLIIFLTTLAVLEFFSRNRGTARFYSLFSILKNRGLWSLGFKLLALLFILMVLYWATTQIGRDGAGFFEAAFVLLAVSVTRILGRLSLPAAMYAHYFPEVEPHYGINNIGLVTKFIGRETYLDTPIVFDYFSNVAQEGSVATCAIMDFYGGFGWTGWFLGCIFLGILLERLDFAFNGQSRNAAMILGKLFCLVFVYYLSQASLPRAMWGYGGLFYLFCWYCLTGFPNSFKSLHPPPVQRNTPAINN